MSTVPVVVDASPPSPASAPSPDAGGRSRSHVGPVRTVARLTLLELRLMVREPMVLVGLLALPVVAMLVIGGVFGEVPDPEFGGVAPDDHYVAGYLGVVLASLGLVTIPVHIATSRELGVTRRYRASGLSATTLVATHMAVGVALGLVSSAILLVVGQLAYDIGRPGDLGGVVAWSIGGLVCYLAIGGALGLLAPTARAATAIGNLLFFPTLLLGGGGPPPQVMSGPMQTVADVIPLTQITNGIRVAWLGSEVEARAWWPALVTVVALVAAVWVARRRAD